MWNLQLTSRYTVQNQKKNADCVNPVMYDILRASGNLHISPLGFPVQLKFATYPHIMMHLKLTEGPSIKAINDLMKGTVACTVDSLFQLGEYNTRGDKA
jgi:hypothetical protein